MAVPLIRADPAPDRGPLATLAAPEPGSWCAIMPDMPPTFDELLTTTRSVRKRLDLTRPVPLDLVEECLEIALQAQIGRAHV